MCRLYAQISPTAQGAKDFLLDSERSFLKQSNFRPDRSQKDGWGFGYFDHGKIKLIKSPGAAFKETARFSSAASKMHSRVIFGHLRAASNPLNLPHRQLIAMENTQPFADGGILFIHNGTMRIPKEVAKFLGPYEDHVRGVNDSEVLFWQFKKFYDLYHDIPQALQACIRELWVIWDLCKSRHPKKKSPYSGLNVIVSDGNSLHALCHWSKPPKETSLFEPRQNWGTLRFARRGKRFIVASESMDGGSWNSLRDPEILSAVVSSSGVSIRRKRFKVSS